MRSRRPAVSARFAAAALSGLLLVTLIGLLSAAAHGSDVSSGQIVDVPASGKITVIGKEFKFIPDAIRVKKGQHVTIVFKNKGHVSHSLTIPDLGLHTPTIQSGSRATISFTAKDTGVHGFWCTVPGHKQAGMKGEVDIVK